MNHSLPNLPSKMVRLTLQTGEIVSLDVSTSSQAETVDAAKNTLISLLASNSPDEQDFQAFVQDVVPTVFKNADPSRPVRVERGMNERGMDLTYDVRNGDGYGIVELLNPKMAHNANADRVVHRIRDYAATLHANTSRRVAELQMIGGRRASEMSGVTIDASTLPFPVQLSTWDDIVDRLTAPLSDDSGATETILVSVLLDASRRILKEIAVTPNLLRKINHRQLEELVLTLLSDIGFSDVHITELGPDGGIDIHVRHYDRRTGVMAYYIFQCKHQVTGGAVHMSVITELEKVVKEKKASGGIVIASGGFGKKVLEQRALLQERSIRLKDATHIHKWIEVWQRIYGSVLLEKVDPIELIEL